MTCCQDQEKLIDYFSTHYPAVKLLSIELSAFVQDGRRRLEQLTAHLALRDREVHLPLATIRELSGTDVPRIYHSSWLIEGSNRVRPILLPEDKELKFPDVIGDYYACLARGDLDGVIGFFDESSAFVEPSGAPFEHRGLSALSRLYGTLCSAAGGIPFAPCSLIDDGQRCVIEYNLGSWAGTSMTMQPGLVIYTRKATRLLAEVRIYDDIAAPDSA